jgi:hypothetical protein
MSEPDLRILSLGGGTQSCALALMSAAGELPRLDHVVFADTQGELPETYAYIDYLRCHLDNAGIPLHIVTAGSLEGALLSAEPTSNNPTPPAHVRNPDGSKGRIGQYRCSYDYKRRIIERQVKALCGGRGAWKQANVEQWIGFSSDEAGRMKQAEGCRCGHPRVSRSGGRNDGVIQVHAEAGCARCDCAAFDRWQTNRWPLIELGFKREETIAWFVANGHPVPPRSACWFCPNSSDARWRDLRDNHPDLFERACVLDETNRNGGGFNARGNVAFAGQMFWHASLEPLRSADIRTKRERDESAGIFTLFDDAEIGGRCDEGGVCFT